MLFEITRVSQGHPNVALKSPEGVPKITIQNTVTLKVHPKVTPCTPQTDADHRRLLTKSQHSFTYT